MDRGRIVIQVVVGVAVGMLLSSAQADTIYVDDDNCPGPGSGLLFDPYCSIQTAIDNAAHTDEIVVAPGTYQEQINFLGKAVTLRSAYGPELTIIYISDLYYHSVVTCESGEGPDTILDGFTITGGFTYNYGGGMYNEGSSPTVMNCTFTRNIGLMGGGMYNTSGSPTIINCTFSESVAGHGGGMYNDGSSPTVVNCTFIRNNAHRGGGILNGDGDSTIANCTFSGNYAGLMGGGMWNVHANPTVTNCTFSGNSAYLGGGMLNNVSNPTVSNCIFWGNSPDEIKWAASGVTYCNVQGGWPGDGNIDADPLFVQAPPPPLSDCCSWRDGSAGCDKPSCEAMVCEQEPFCCSAYWDWDCVELAGLLCGDLCAWPTDLRLSPGSPSIDAGDTTAVPGEITTDLDGNPRFVDDPGLCDLGKFDGVNPVVDIGAFEFQDRSPLVDCNDNGEPDTCDIVDEVSLDCNANVVPDECDIAEGTSADVNGNGVPDECECLGDCGLPADGQVNVGDFLALLSQWGNVGASCDIDGGGVGATDFLILLAQWGPCP